MPESSDPTKEVTVLYLAPGDGDFTHTTLVEALKDSLDGMRVTIVSKLDESTRLDFSSLNPHCAVIASNRLFTQAPWFSGLQEQVGNGRILAMRRGGQFTESEASLLAEKGVVAVTDRHNFSRAVRAWVGGLNFQ